MYAARPRRGRRASALLPGLMSLLVAIGCSDHAMVARAPDAAGAPDAREALPLDARTIAPDAHAAGDAQGPAEDAALPADAGQPRWPIDQVEELTLYLNLGDSLGAGYNAGPGRGYAALLCATLGAPRCANDAESGADSAGVARQALALPDSSGDTIATIYVGGNDFNDDLRTILSEVRTREAIDRWTANLTTVLQRLTGRYRDEGQGRTLIIALANIHDPTGGLGTVPPEFRDGFCATIQNPLFTEALRARALDNLATFNAAIAAFAASHQAILIDSHALLLGHGMNAPPADRWLDTDCAHATDAGHEALRGEIRRLLTGR